MPEEKRTRQPAKQSLLMESLTRFYQTEEHAEIAKAFLVPGSGKSRTLSLRTIDWWVTTYARRNSVCILLDDGRLIDLHSSYKSQLKSFSKRRFDVFKRGETILFDLSGDMVETTASQLCFFRWIIQNNVAQYMTSHAHEIERAMKDYFKEKTEAPSGLKKKRVCSTSTIVSRIVFD